MLEIITMLETERHIEECNMCIPGCMEELCSQAEGGGEESCQCVGKKSTRN